ncbi:MAG TPA: hypothetical protein DIC64_01655, partial [Alphaproteobacteria bacterium]|nr:hypothetical protein [Alphaproteobacteria bacterium]
MSKNIFYQLVVFSIAAFMASAGNATEQCETLPDCASIGYTFTEQQCGDLLKIKCPFGNAYFCSKANCSVSSGYYDTEEECAGTGFVCAEDAQSGCWVKSGCNSAEGYYENAPTDSYLTYSTISVEGVTCYYNIHCDEDQKYFDSNPGTAACSSLTPPDGSGWQLVPTYATPEVPEGSKRCWQCLPTTCEIKTRGAYWSTNAVPSSFSCNTPTTMIISIGDYTPTDALDAANHNALCVKRTCSSTPVSCSAYTETNGWISYTSGTATEACIAKHGTGYTSTDTETCNNIKYTKCAPATTCSALGYMDGSSLGIQNSLEYLYKEVSVNGLTCYDKTDKKAFSNFAATSFSKWVNTSLHCDPDLTG